MSERRHLWRPSYFFLAKSPDTLSKRHNTPMERGTLLLPYMCAGIAWVRVGGEVPMEVTLCGFSLCFHFLAF